MFIDHLANYGACSTYVFYRLGEVNVLGARTDIPTFKSFVVDMKLCIRNNFHDPYYPDLDLSHKLKSYGWCMASTRSDQVEINKYLTRLGFQSTEFVWNENNNSLTAWWTMSAVKLYEVLNNPSLLIEEFDSSTWTGVKTKELEPA